MSIAEIEWAQLTYTEEVMWVKGNVHSDRNLLKGPCTAASAATER
jgi:hypothetical protein